MRLLAPAGLLALLALPAILLLYFLKVRRPPVTVATLMFWRQLRTDRQANAPWQRLRASLLLVLQLAVALALALALARPGVTGAAGVSASTVILLDGTASMQATDVKPSRFGAAVVRAKLMAGRMAPGQEMSVVLLGQRTELLSPPTGDAGAIDAALDAARPRGGQADLGAGLSLAGALLAGRAGASIVLLSDGHASVPPIPPRVPASFTFVPIGVSGENAGIETLTRNSAGAVFARVANYGRRPRDLQVEMRADGRLADVLPVHVESDSTVLATWTALPGGTEVLEARLTPGDALRMDDSAWLVTGSPPEHRVLLVTAENGFMEKAMKLRAGLQLTVLKPADYRAGPYDLYVFDRFLPPGPLPHPALVIDPPEGSGPVPSGPDIDPGGVLPANPREPLLHDVILRDIHVQSAAKVSIPADWRPLISATGGPLLLVHDGEPRLAELTFDLHHSDLPLRPAFPVLVRNLMSSLLPSGFENGVFQPEQPVTLIAEPGARSLDVTAPDGRSTRFGPPYPAVLGDTAVGVYTVRQQTPEGIRLSRFVVQLQNPSLSRISPGGAPVVVEQKAVSGPAPRGIQELWPWIAAAVLALLMLEWTVYHRRA